MTDRNLEFKAYFPQLQNDPGKFKGGVKRYNLRKNEDSPGFLLGGSSNSLVYSPLLVGSYSNIGTTSRGPGFDEVNRSYTKLSPLPKQYRDIKSPYLQSKFHVNSSVNSDIYSLMKHPAFKQPNYTKLRPKVMNNNPIVGYSNRESFSPEPFRGVFNSGDNLKSMNKYKY